MQCGGNYALWGLVGSVCKSSGGLSGPRGENHLGRFGFELKKLNFYILYN